MLPLIHPAAVGSLYWFGRDAWFTKGEHMSASGLRKFVCTMGLAVAMTVTAGAIMGGCNSPSGDNSCSDDDDCTMKYGDEAYCSIGKCYYFGEDTPIGE